MSVTFICLPQITQLKIENNPFAKGFRSPFSRCRTRNQPRYICICIFIGKNDLKKNMMHLLTNICLLQMTHKLFTCFCVSTEPIPCNPLGAVTQMRF